MGGSDTIGAGGYRNDIYRSVDPFTSWTLVTANALWKGEISVNVSIVSIPNPLFHFPIIPYRSLLSRQCDSAGLHRVNGGCS